MEKIWLKNYPPGIPAEIDPDQCQSIYELFEKNCQKYEAVSSFHNLGVDLTYAELKEKARDLAAYFQKELGLKKGDRIAIMLPNLLHYPIVLFAALRAGLIIVNVNPLYTAQELAYQLKDSGAETIVVLENFASTLQAAIEQTRVKHVLIAHIGDFFPLAKAWAAQFVLKYVQRKIPDWNIPHSVPFKKALTAGVKHSLDPVDIHNEDVAFLQYTGGTTGVSKGAMLTHRNIIANIEQAYAWFGSFFQPGKEVVITALPLYHIFSLTVNCLLYATKVGGVNVLITNPRDLSSMISELEKFKFTCITGVNTLFNALVKSTRFKALDFSSLRIVVGGGMAVQGPVAQQWQNVTGHCILEGYGLTETSPCVAANPVNLKAYSGNIGYPLPSTDVCILDEQGQEVTLGEAGELAVKGPQVMKGYWQQPDETEKAFNADGWFLTGDIASMDTLGQITILERKKDMILVSGFNVYPNEVENVIAGMPGVKEVAVVGEPDESSGEVVKAYIVKSNPELTQAEVRRYCRNSLTPYKVPKYVEFTDELPKTNVGKILRRALRSKPAK